MGMVHRFILAARSVVFKGMMEVDMKEKTTGVVEIKDVVPEVVTEFINYLYSDKISDDFTNLTELLMIGHRYQVWSLVEKCSEKLSKEVSVDNVARLGALAENYNASELSVKCAEFMSDNYEKMKSKEEDFVPLSLLSKAVAARIKKSVEETPLAEETKILYLANFVENQREPIAVDTNYEDGCIQTEFMVTRTVKLVGVGIYISMKEMPIELSLSCDHGDSAVNTSMSTTLSSMDWSKPLKIMFGARYNHRVKIFFEANCVRFGKARRITDEVNIEMRNGDVKVIISNPIQYNSEPQIPLLYFEE